MEKQAGLRVPNAFIIVFIMMLVVTALTYIIPAGRYEFVQGTKIIDPASFHFVAASSVGPWSFINSIFGGMRRSSTIILFTFLVGGYFYVLIATGAIDRFIVLLIRRLGDNALLLLPLLMVVMAVLGAVGIMANPVVAVVPVGLILAKRLGLDRLMALALTFVSAYVGYSMSPMCAMTVQTAQKIADIPILSGFVFRSAGMAVMVAITIIYIMHYAYKVKRDNLGAGDWLLDDSSNSDLEAPFRRQDFLVLLGLVVGLGIYIYGSFAYKWGLEYMAGAMFCVAAFAAAVTGMGAEGFVKSFLTGASKMCFSAMLIGLATSVAVLLNEGQIMHTLVHYIALFMQQLPEWTLGPVMFYANIFFNFFVSSGSGQAAVVMPIMAPLADVVGISRQMAVCAFQYGDGLSNAVFPTNGTMMASIAIAGVAFDRWLRWMLPLFLLWTAVATVIVITGVALAVA